MAKKAKQDKLPPLPVNVSMNPTELLEVKNIGLEKNLLDAQYSGGLQNLALRRAQWSAAFIAKHKLGIGPDQLWELYDVDLAAGNAVLKSSAGKAAAG